MSANPFVEMWRNLAQTASRSHPVRNPALAQRRAISVIPAKEVPGQPRGTIPYWAVQVETTQQALPREVLAIRDGVVLYGADGVGPPDTTTSGPFTGAFTPAFEQGGAEAPPVEYDPLVNGVILGIKMGTTLVVVLYQDMESVTVNVGPVKAGDVLGTANADYVSISAFRATAADNPLETLFWATDPLRTIFPTDTLWTRNPPRRALV